MPPKKAEPLEAKDVAVDDSGPQDDADAAAESDLDARLGHLKGYPADGDLQEKQEWEESIQAEPTLLADAEPEAQVDNVTTEPVPSGPSFEEIVKEAQEKEDDPVDQGVVSDEIREQHAFTQPQVVVLDELPTTDQERAKANEVWADSDVKVVAEPVEDAGVAEEA